MTAVYPDLILVEFYNGTAWVDISAYVVGDIHATRGLGGWQPTKRVAMLGTLIVVLNNKAKLFSPMGGDAARGLNTLTGFTRGAKIRVRILYRGSYYTRWMGRILTIDSDDKNWGPEHARVYATDWMDVPANFPMKRADIALDKTMDEAIALILARLSIQPEATDIDVGTFEFPAVFDGVKNQTMAIGELNKLALSELGYIYVKGDGTLRAENRDARLGGRALDTIDLDPATIGYLLKEDGGYLLKEDGGKIVLDEMTAGTAVALFADAESYDILMDRDALLNSATVRVYPKVTDTSLKVLYSLGKPFYIAGNGTVEFSAHYTDPNGFLQASGTNMQTPAATTDYLSNTLEDGTGTDRTSDLAVTATYYGDTVDYSIYNGHGDGVWVTFLQARGYGIYHGNSIEYQFDDATSQADFGFSAFLLDQPYRKEATYTKEYAQLVVDEYKKPKSRITKLNYLANLNENHMASFLQLDVGSLVKVTEDRSNISNGYYITDAQFNIKQGGVVNVTYGVQENPSYPGGGLEPLTVEFASSPDMLNYGKLSRLEDLTLKSISVWLYQDTLGTYSAFITKHRSEHPSYAGWRVGIFNNSGNLLVLYDEEWTNEPQWLTPAGSFATGAWKHVVVTVDNSGATPDVHIYIGGTDQSLTASPAPSGTRKSDADTEFFVGGRNYYFLGEQYVSFDGKVFDARIYDRILSQAEVTAIYNSGTPSALVGADDMIFQGPAGYAEDGSATSRAGEVVTTASRVIENALRTSATPNGAPTIRANP